MKCSYKEPLLKQFAMLHSAIIKEQRSCQFTSNLRLTIHILA